MIVVEDHRLACGFGSAILEQAAAKLGAGGERMMSSGKLSAVRLLGAPLRFIKHDLRAMQLMQAGISADKIVQAAEEMMGGRKKRRTRELPEHRQIDGNNNRRCQNGQE